MWDVDSSAEYAESNLQHLLRVSYYFNSGRNAFLLTGGDKKGKIKISSTKI